MSRERQKASGPAMDEAQNKRNNNEGVEFFSRISRRLRRCGWRFEYKLNRMYEAAEFFTSCECYDGPSAMDQIGGNVG
jgi:hypothetical protein